MQFEQTRGEWMERSQASSAPSTLSAISQRRRSSAAYRPAGPPPAHPIPSLPPADSQDLPQSRPSFARAPSAGLAAVAYFSHLRPAVSAPADPTPLHAPDDFADPPPTPAVAVPMAESATSTSRHLSPPNTEHRPSSRRALTRALELAREAVQLDSTNEDPEAAVQAYAQSVALLSEVMERVRRGEDSTESRRGRRRRSVAAQEEEVRRLQNIHDTYADRMNILSIIYSIPPVPYPSTQSYPPTRSVSSTTANSPTASHFPSHEGSPQIPQASYTIPHQSKDDAQYNEIATDEALAPLGSHLSFTDAVHNISGLPPSSSSQHPYSYNPPEPTNSLQQPAPRPTAPLKQRSRASSALPPLQPPPANPLPPAPVPPDPLDSSQAQPPLRSDLQPPPEHTARRLSGLESVSEESDDTRLNHAPRTYSDDVQDMVLDTPRNPKRDSHPLPPIPSPTGSGDSSGTPRTSLHISNRPASPRTTHPPGGPRKLSIAKQSEILAPTATQPVTIINPTTLHGTIHQRRAKTSLSSRSASPTDSTLSTGSVPSQKQHPPLPAVPAPSTHTGRARSSSQPGRRPSVVNAAIEQRPPLPPSAGANLSTRKPSFPSKLVSNPSLTAVQQFTGTDGFLPQTGTPTPSFVPPSLSMSSGGVVPYVPASNMPPPQPNDPLRKPYYMMDLLAASMASPTGGYITRRLHVPNEVWTFSGVKLSNVAEKIRVLEILQAALEELQITSSEYFGAGNVSSGMAMGIGSIGPKEANAWLAKLEEFLTVCDTIVGDYGKKIGVGEAFVLKKTTWGGKLSRRFEKFANGKNVDSPTAYMHSLKKLFQNAQLLDEHTKAIFTQPVAPAYAAFSSDVRISAEQKLKRASEFFASVVLAFVIRDLALLLDKYVKKCEKVLED